MASEDSVEDLVDRTTTLLPIVVHRVRDLYDGRQPAGLAVQAVFEQMYGIFKQLHIGAPGRELHVLPHKRQDVRRDILPRIDREREYIRITRLRPDPAALKNLLRHFKELSASPVLVNKELRLDVKAEGMGWMPLYRKTPTALTLHDAGHKPASRLCTRQSFLLIVRTQHIVTIPPTSDGLVAWDTTDFPAYS